jgi:hypothetical protein
MILFTCHVQDDNRYNAGRGAHLMLKRAEKARILVNKIPGNIAGLDLLLLFNPHGHQSTIAMS